MRVRVDVSSIISLTACVFGFEKKTGRVERGRSPPAEPLGMQTFNICHSLLREFKGFKRGLWALEKGLRGVMSRFSQGKVLLFRL